MSTFFYFYSGPRGLLPFFFFFPKYKVSSQNVMSCDQSIEGSPSNF